MTIYPDATEMTIAQWRELLEGPDPRIAGAFSAIYADDGGLHRERLALFRSVLEGAAKRLPPDLPCALIRVPGRINTMGLHSDGQYSFKNHVVFAREIVAVVHKRDDDTVSLVSPHQEYREHSFSISEVLSAQQRGSAWIDIVEAAEIEVGGWQNYLIGPILALQNRYYDRELCGLDFFVDGDIPVAAGVSSSSALATLAGIATIYFNQLEIPWGEAVRVIGAGEWYSGSRGGPGDTGVQMLCRRGHILHVKYDISFERYEEHLLPFPEDWRIVLCNTLVTSRKTIESLETATSRGLAQAAGMVILREHFPDLLGGVTCLAHVSPEHLDVRLADVYEMLKVLPERASTDELPRLAPAHRDELAPIMRHWRVSLRDFPLRPVCMYMVCEPARGARNKPVVEARDDAALGELMAAAHDGDRVVRWLDDEHCEPYDSSAGDELLDRLSRMAQSDDPSQREAAQLHRQPGGFACSCPELDLLVDICDRIDGVIGARITGAGLGGCMFAYAHKDAVPEVLDQVKRRYYAPRGLPLAAWELFPIERGGPLALPGR